MGKIDQKLLGPDYSSPVTGGDFRLKEVSIHSPSNDSAQSLDTPSVFVELDIFISDIIIQNSKLREVICTPLDASFEKVICN